MTSAAADLETDYVVIGGGSGGAVVAARLAEAGKVVVLVEAGPDYGPFGQPSWPADLVDARMLATSHDWRYASAPWTFERARVIGGCSSHNGAIAAVGHRDDYTAWGLAGWSGDDVAGLFATVLERMRVRAYERSEAVPFHEECLQAAAALGWHVASDLCDLDAGESFGLETVNVVGTTRWNTAFAYLDPVRHLANLTIVDRALVDRFSSSGGGYAVDVRRVAPLPHSGTEAFDPSRHGEQLTIRSTRVVLAAGAYGTPAILQRSGVGDPDRLRAVGVTPVVALAGVGANLHDHPLISPDRAVTDRLQAHLDAVAATGFLPEEQTLGKFTSAHSATGRYDLHVFPVCASDQTSLVHGRVLAVAAALQPRSRGRVDIVSPDPRVAPFIDHRYLSDPEGHDLSVLRDGLAIAHELLGHRALDGLLADPVTDLSSDEAIRANVAHYYHPVGTCAMGAGDDAVCDHDGAVHGLDDVFVADASLFPTIPRANTNMPTIMAGERVAGGLLRSAR